MGPDIMMSLLGGLGGLFSGPQSPEIDPRMQMIFKQIMNASRGARNYGKGVPGSDPQEQAAMAQAMALLGTQQNGDMQAMFGAANPATGSQGFPDMMKNATQANQMGMSGLTSGMMMDFLGKRQNAKFSIAPGLAQSAAGAAGSMYRPAQPTGWESLSPMLASLAYTMSRRRGMQDEDDYQMPGPQPTFYPHSGSYL